MGVLAHVRQNSPAARAFLPSARSKITPTPFIQGRQKASTGIGTPVSAAPEVMQISANSTVFGAASTAPIAPACARSISARVTSGGSALTICAKRALEARCTGRWLCYCPALASARR